MCEAITARRACATATIACASRGISSSGPSDHSPSWPGYTIVTASEDVSSASASRSTRSAVGRSACSARRRTQLKIVGASSGGTAIWSGSIIPGIGDGAAAAAAGAAGAWSTTPCDETRGVACGRRARGAGCTTLSGDGWSWWADRSVTSRTCCADRCVYGVRLSPAGAALVRGARWVGGS